MLVKSNIGTNLLGQFLLQPEITDVSVNLDGEKHSYLDTFFGLIFMIYIKLILLLLEHATFIYRKFYLDFNSNALQLEVFSVKRI